MLGTEDEALPLYRRIYRDLEHKIDTGEIAYREQLPVLPDLCRLYGVSAAPVRRALDELARDGLVVKRRGRGQGTFANRRPVAATAAATARILLLGDFDLERSAIALCHEVFDLLAGLRDAARDAGVAVQQVSRGGLGHLPPAGPGVGYLIVGMSGRDYAEGVRLAAGAPCVLVNAPGPVDGQGVCSVRVDMEQGGFLGANYLAKLGHRRIAYVGGVAGDWFAPRYAGYLRALGANGLSADPDLVRPTGGIAPEEDRAALDALLALPEPPTALFAASDYRALHLLAHARVHGAACPWDLSLCGYDDVPEAAGIVPSLTTVRHPRYELGVPAVALLLDLLAGRPGEDRLVRPELIVRDSCAALT